MTRARFLGGLALLASAAAPTGARAAAVLDPIPFSIAPGPSVGLLPWTTAPATGPIGTMQALVQGARAPADGSGRLFFNDSRGVISLAGARGAAPTVFFDIRQQGVGFLQTNGQTGLLSFAFHPNFGRDPAKPGYATFYTVDTTADGGGERAPDYRGNGPVDHDDVVREWTVRDPRAAVAEVTGRRELLRVGQPLGDHGPGTISFDTAAEPGADDYGQLYIGLGDGGGVNDPFNNAQDLRSPFGKILRIDPADPDGDGPRRYGVPAGNPYAGGKDAVGKPALGEVWASGLRNPQSFTWDPVTGDMLIGDIGQAQVEEVDVGRAGANYGWPQREGTFGRYADKGDLRVNDDPNPGFADPAGQYDHGEGNALSGMLIYRGRAIPGLVGQGIASDLVTGRLFTWTPGDTSGVGGTAVLRELQLSLGGAPTSLFALEGDEFGRADLRLGLDAAGEVYLLTKEKGDVYRLVAADTPEPATWALAVLGTGLAGAALRRRRVGAVAAA